MPFINAFKNINVLVIGEAILDSYLEGFSDRLCQEAPVPIVTLTHRQNVPGGAANTALNVRTLGANVRFLSVIGDDLEGNILRQALLEQGVSQEYILRQRLRRTLAKHRVISAGQILVRFDQGSTNAIDLEIEQRLIKDLHKLFPQSDVVIISDYGYGILTPNLIEAIANLQQNFPKTLVVDSKNLAAYRKIGVTAVKPNYQETMRLLGETELPENQSRISYILQNRKQILDITGAKIAAVTLDSDGALIFAQGNSPYRTFAQPINHANVTGAGDTFISALALALASGNSANVAAEIASMAAAIVVAKQGTATCSFAELQQQLFSNLNKMKKTPLEVA
ncbi:bifunctional heptose 7-phosphate kinase/heptose 1-phosphate adenyltransferase [Floridanema evergladense]|uniref:Bifunctional heptose 7-phosphate kinase/heptose 1-phosphate adenyltransferase n=1 Tax=Floridaenema evergladense BLCC-F167 TaxID=3153639 RepID=A0ABV4WII4_9CYAN